MTGAPLYWEALSTCELVLVNSSVSNIMLNKCSNHMKTLGGGGGKAREKIEARAKVPLT